MSATVSSSLGLEYLSENWKLYHTINYLYVQMQMQRRLDNLQSEIVRKTLAQKRTNQRTHNKKTYIPRVIIHLLHRYECMMMIYGTVFRRNV